MRIGPAIRDARIEAALSQQALADKAGVSRAWLARLEAGHRRAEAEQVFKVLSALGLSMTLTPRRTSTTEQTLLTALRAAGRA
ncbi:helix-turn-helix domain-containing protein [Nakamurella lactea]|uniref:helix-turn-helix domain-containing protein n=1 Tax=Nakamurella lactea TaxID=459515 RepID=UPI001B7F9754